jgi:hypothetical protein
MTIDWFSPAPSEIAVSRISLDFGLRAADLYFRELVAPGLGRVWFARQLSWPLAALVLHKELAGQGSRAPKPVAICHGIEALACKLEHLADADSKRILGKRAFGRDKENNIWKFKDLLKATNYVRNTHRQAATRALRAEGGIGFASGPRFDLLELEPVGLALANAFLEQRVGKGGMSLRKWLLRWLDSGREISGEQETLRRALSPESPTEKERELVRSRLLGISTPEGMKRERLAKAVGHAERLPDIDDIVVNRLREASHDEQADQIVAARAFGVVLDRARDAVAELTSSVEPEPRGMSLEGLVRDSAIRKSIDALQADAKKFLEKSTTANVTEQTSCSFAKDVVDADDRKVIRLLVGRAGELLALADGSVFRGPLFRVIDDSDDSGDIEDGSEKIEPDRTIQSRTGRAFRIANFHALLRDVDPRGGQ